MNKGTPADPLIERAWECKIGAKVGELPNGADWPLRSAVMDAFKALTGYECEFIFSGWGAEVSPLERAVVNHDDDAAIGALAAKPAGPIDFAIGLDAMSKNRDAFAAARVGLGMAPKSALAAKPADPVYIDPEEYKQLVAYRGGGPMEATPGSLVAAEKVGRFTMALVPAEGAATGDFGLTTSTMALKDGSVISGPALTLRKPGEALPSITERELAFALNYHSDDTRIGDADWKIARRYFEVIERNRGAHPSLVYE